MFVHSLIRVPFEIDAVCETIMLYHSETNTLIWLLCLSRQVTVKYLILPNCGRKFLDGSPKFVQSFWSRMDIIFLAALQENLKHFKTNRV